MKQVICTISVCFIALAAFAGDILTLHNQMVFEGKVTKIKDCSVVFKANGETYVVPANDIYSIEFGDVTDKVYTDYMSLAEGASDKCLNGRFDAEEYHGKKGSHFLLGVLFGPLAMVVTAVAANPIPERGRQTNQLSQNRDQFYDLEYLSCYKKRAKGQLIAMEGLGWGTWILIVLSTL
jgi:hypothetical protein